MAKFRFRLKDNESSVSEILMLVIIKDRKFFIAPTGFFIEPEKWCNKTNMPEPNYANLRITNTLKDLRNYVAIQMCTTGGEKNLKKDWLRNKVMTFYNNQEKLSFYLDFNI